MSKKQKIGYSFSVLALTLIVWISGGIYLIFLPALMVAKTIFSENTANIISIVIAYAVLFGLLLRILLAIWRPLKPIKTKN